MLCHPSIANSLIRHRITNDLNFALRINKMYKIIFAVIFACIACASAGVLTAAPSAVVYTSSPEFPSASGYEYQHTIQTADYANHASVVKPLNGFVDAPALVRTVYNAPFVAAPAW